MDPLDLGVIRLLQEDGRTTAARIAAGLGISEVKAGQRLDALLRAGVVRLVALVDPALHGRRVVFLLGIRTDACTDAVAGELAAMAEMQWVVTSEDVVSVWAQGSVGSSEELLELVNRRVRAIPGVRSVQTDVPLRIWSAAFTFPGQPVDAAPAAPQTQPWTRGGSTRPLDQIDLALVTALEEDPRASFTAMSRGVGLSVPATRQRVLRLLGEDIVRIQALPDPLRLGRTVPAILRLHVSTDTLPVVQALVAMPAATVVAETTGPTEVEVEFFCHCVGHLARCVADVQALPGVGRVDVGRYATVVKSSGRW